MHYSETLEATTPGERKKLLTEMIVLFFLPFLFAAVGYWLKTIDAFWSVFAWIGAGMLAITFLFKVFRDARDDFFSHKIIYKGVVLEVNPVKMGYGTSASMTYEFVLEKKTLKINEKALQEIHLVDVPLPTKGEQVEIHSLPKSGDIIRLLVNRNGKWESVKLK